jgi:hypothetical protein
MSKRKLPKRGDGVRVCGHTHVPAALVHVVVEAPTLRLLGETACRIGLLREEDYGVRNSDEIVSAPVNCFYCLINRPWNR